MQSHPDVSEGSAAGRVCTLGMFIIDHFNVNEMMEPVDQPSIGGGGVHAAVAARLFLPPARCGMIIDRGQDFPEAFESELNAYGEGMIWYRPRSGKTTRAINMYSGGQIGEGLQTFRYISPQLNLCLRDLILPPSPFGLPSYVHVVARIPRATEIAQEAAQIGQNGVNGHGRGWVAKMIWEPLDIQHNDSSQLDAWIALAPSYLVLSPNLVELETVLGIQRTRDATMADVESAAQRFHSLLQPPAVLVLRAGALGSFTISQAWTGWTPAYWRSTEQDHVVDPTGGGNAFMGGLCAGLLLSKEDWQKACVYASAAASFAIEQRGLPRFELQGGEEQWNGVHVRDRLSELMARVYEHQGDCINP